VSLTTLFALGRRYRRAHPLRCRRSTQQRSVPPRLPLVGSGPQRGLGGLFESGRQGLPNWIAQQRLICTVMLFGSTQSQRRIARLRGARDRASSPYGVLPCGGRPLPCRPTSGSIPQGLRRRDLRLPPTAPIAPADLMFCQKGGPMDPWAADGLRRLSRGKAGSIMPARRRQLLGFFRQCLWRFRLSRLYAQTRCRLQRCCVASALDRDASGF
jgi:hypothetical protein